MCFSWKGNGDGSPHLTRPPGALPRPGAPLGAGPTSRGCPGVWLGRSRQQALPRLRLPDPVLT